MPEIWSFYHENHQICCHQMSDFKAKMHQIQFRLGLRPRPRWGSLRRGEEEGKGARPLLADHFNHCIYVVDNIGEDRSECTYCRYLY